MDVLRVLAIRTFPVHGEPPVEHDFVNVGEGGLAGDRPKKAAVSLVGADLASTRANLVLDGSTERVEALGGALLRIGEVLVAVQATGTTCRGLYATVGEPGRISVGDTVEPA